MKNITAQYRDLQEGKLSKANFMTNVRREFPQWISSGNTFDDAVRILRSKRILSEGIHDRDMTSASHTNIKTPPKGVGDYDPKAAADRLARLGKLGPKPKRDDEEAGGYDPELANMGRYVTENSADTTPEELKQELAGMLDNGEISSETYEKAIEKLPSFDIAANTGITGSTPREVAIELIAAVGGDIEHPRDYDEDDIIDFDDDSDYMEFREAEGGRGLAEWVEGFNSELENRNLGPETKARVIRAMELVKPEELKRMYGMLQTKYAVNAFLSDVDEILSKESLNEAEKKEPTIDQVDYIQLKRGTEFEMSKMPVISDENYAKAKQKAYKNLVKDSNAYRHLSVANYKEVKKKDKALETQEIKKDNLADKANEQKTIVKNAKLNTKDTLGKQEKAKKGVPEGVKQLREAMLKEFQAVPEQKKTFAVGHEVATPDGKAGRITDLTQDNTATVEFPDGTTGDYQTNVLKTNVPGTVFSRNVGNPRTDLSKFTKEELKEKLVNAMKEGYVVKSKKTGAVVDSGKNPAQGVTGAKNLEKTTGSQLKVVDTETGKETEV